MPVLDFQKVHIAWLASQLYLKFGVVDPHFFAYKMFDGPNKLQI